MRPKPRQNPPKLEKIPANRAERVDAVFVMLLRAASEDQVRQIATTEWGVPEEEAALLIVLANERFQKVTQLARDVENGKAVLQLMDLYGRSLKDEDYGQALTARRQLSALLGLAGQSTAAPKASAPDPLADDIDRLERELGVS